jgi:hypothetical protein
MRSGNEVLKAVASALALAQEAVSDAEFDRYDRLVAHAKPQGGAPSEASAATSLATTYQSLLMVAIGVIANWTDRGEEAALNLPDANAFDDEIAPDTAPERELVRQCAHVLRLLAWVEVRDTAREAELGKALLPLMNALLAFDEQFELAIRLALLSRDILIRLGDADARRGQLVAYRLLLSPRRLPFLPDLPPAKFPPPIPPALDEGAILTACLHFIRHCVVDEIFDLGTVLLEMRDDPETVICNTLGMMIGDRQHQLRLELSFSPELIEWAFADDETLGDDAASKLRAYLEILCENPELLDRFRDDDYGLVYQTLYLGLDAPSAPRLRQAMKIESIGEQLRCVVGIDVDAVRISGARDLASAMQRDRLLSHLRDTVAVG